MAKIEFDSEYFKNKPQIDTSCMDTSIHEVLHKQIPEGKPKKLLEQIRKANTLDNPRKYLEQLIKNDFLLTEDYNFMNKIEKEISKKEALCPYWLNSEQLNSYSTNILTKKALKDAIEYSKDLPLKTAFVGDVIPKKTTLNGRSYNKLILDELVSKTEKDNSLIAAGRQLGKSGMNAEYMRQEIELYFLRKSYISIMVIIKLEEASYKHDEYYKSKVSKVSWDDSKKQVEIMFSKEKYKFHEYQTPIIKDVFKHIFYKNQLIKAMYGVLGGYSITDKE